jgi:hypothetical protein
MRPVDAPRARESFYYDSSQVNPVEIAMHDEEYHIIEGADAHRFKGSKAYRANLQFLNKWTNEAKPS